METKLKITYKVCGVEFSAITETIAEAYRYIVAIIKANEVSFPNRDHTLSEYMGVLVGFKDAGTIKHENHIFRIEVA